LLLIRFGDVIAQKTRQIKVLPDKETVHATTASRWVPQIIRVISTTSWSETLSHEQSLKRRILEVQMLHGFHFD
jgi:hypothetical protein